MDRRIRLRFALGVVLVSVAVGIASACQSGDYASAKQKDYDRFVAAAASAPSDGYAPYWLGREFRAGGLTFRGPGVGGIGDDVEGGGLEANYSAEVLKDSYVELQLVMYSPKAWSLAIVRVLNQPEPRRRRKTAQVRGENAELLIVPAGTRPINALVLIVSFGDTTIQAIASSGGPATPGGPDLNPLIDEATFLSVLQNLRPYPQ
jgi:hypothetical protein